MVTIIKKNVSKKNRNNINSSENIGGGNTIIMGDNIKVIDNLTSVDTANALSANQGKILNETKLSKVKPDNAKEVITFDKGLITKGDIKTDDIDLNTGASLTKDANGDWNLVVDNAEIRNKLQVETLKLEEVKAVGGKIICSKAGITIAKIGEDENIYRCYFRNQDNNGLVVYNQFVEGDLAFCQTFHNNKIKRYWRYVTGVGDDFVDLSKSDYEIGSNAPEPGDLIVLLGNRHDVTRQGALVIETEAMNIYNNINTFTLPNPIVTINPNASVIGDGSSSLTVKGVIEAMAGRIGNFVIKNNGLYNDASTEHKAHITITDNNDASLATKSFIVNPADLPSGEKGSIVEVSHRVDNGDGIVASTTNGNAIWGITENGLALTGYAHGENGIGLTANKAIIDGLTLGMLKIENDNFSIIPISNERDIIVISENVNEQKIISLPKCTGGKIYMIRNNSSIGHVLRSANDVDLFENINGTKKILNYNIRGNSNLMLIYTGNWSIVYER